MSVEVLRCNGCGTPIQIQDECYSLHYKRPMGIDLWLSFCSREFLEEELFEELDSKTEEIIMLENKLRMVAHAKE